MRYNKKRFSYGVNLLGVVGLIVLFSVSGVSIRNAYCQAIPQPQAVLWITTPPTQFSGYMGWGGDDAKRILQAWNQGWEVRYQTGSVLKLDGTMERFSYQRVSDVRVITRNPTLVIHVDFDDEVTGILPANQWNGNWLRNFSIYTNSHRKIVVNIQADGTHIRGTGRLAQAHEKAHYNLQFEAAMEGIKGGQRGKPWAKYVAKGTYTLNLTRNISGSGWLNDVSEGEITVFLIENRKWSADKDKSTFNENLWKNPPDTADLDQAYQVFLEFEEKSRIRTSLKKSGNQSRKAYNRKYGNRLARYKAPNK